MLNRDTGPPVLHGQPIGPVAGPTLWLRLPVYGAFFLSGATALVFEILWSRQFVTVFGASTYAISVVLCAFMAGLGVGAWLGGQLADRFRERLLMYGTIQWAIAVWAAGMPLLLAALRRSVTGIALLAPESPLLSAAARFLIAFGILFVPCALMGATLPLLSRLCTESRRVIGARVSLLYGLNTLGATLGCFAAGYWLIDTVGLSVTNQVAVGTNLLIAAGALALGLEQRRRRVPIAVRPALKPAEGAPESGIPAPAPEDAAPGGRPLLLAIAFVSGLAALSCEVLWVRYLSPLSNIAYTFTTILGIYLLGIGIGSLIYRFLLGRLGRPLPILAAALLLLAVTVPVCFALGALISSSRETGPLGLWPMTTITVLAATMLMGMAFPLICAAYARSVATVGRSVGVVYAVNAGGTIIGSLIPVFVLIPAAGIQNSIFLMCLLYWAAGVALLWASSRRRGLLRPACAGALTLLVVLAFGLVGPADLCRRVILSTHVQLGRHRDVIFYREGKTSTEVIARDRVSGLKYLYMNGAIEVTSACPEMMSFKLMAGLGPLLHANPDEVLMVCFGGGIASGAAAQFADVKSVLAIDLEKGVLEGARFLEEENNSVLNDPKVSVAIDDGRNYVLMSRKKWPVIVSDSLHPKSSDSWVLYTREFYRTMGEHLTDDGVFVQWVPFQRVSVTEYKSIVRTFQSVFPHTSLWFAHGVAKNGLYGAHTLLVATPDRLTIDVGALDDKLSAPQVAADLLPWGLGNPAGLLETFVCGEERLVQWTGDGPINTDDLPYVQYKTKYSAGPECRAATFAPLLESVWPYLRNAGDEAQAKRLQRELALHMQANALVLTNQMTKAFSLLPEDPKLRKWRQNLALGVQWIWAVADYYPERASALSWLAERAMALPDNWDQAIALYDRALTLEPDNAVAHHNLGLGLTARGSLDAGIAHYLTALQLNPNSAETYSNLGMALAAQGRTNQAMARWAQALRLKPRLAPAHRSMGVVLSEQGSFEAAAAHFSEALKIDPGDGVAEHGLRLALQEIRQRRPQQ